MRLLGIDYGSKRIGIALSDEMGVYSFPYGVIQNKGIKKNVNVIQEICEKEIVNKVVLGESINYSGKHNPIMEEIEEFKKEFEEKTDLITVYQEEILTTQEAKKIISEGKPRGILSQKRKPKASEKQKIDASAASLILKSFIEGSKMVE